MGTTGVLARRGLPHAPVLPDSIPDQPVDLVRVWALHPHRVLARLVEGHGLDQDPHVERILALLHVREEIADPDIPMAKWLRQHLLELPATVVCSGRKYCLDIRRDHPDRELFEKALVAFEGFRL